MFLEAQAFRKSSTQPRNYKIILHLNYSETFSIADTQFIWKNNDLSQFILSQPVLLRVLEPGERVTPRQTERRGRR